ncbi:hypothetical protein AC579_9446 [Pseudocercospora musae]|uniref:SMP-30/Gluconolactonase/LRE-like region domain-containing protein n=1 Tax=Pseudocercospora musae TaxID=113226 RepID=A0A139HBG4_9PEZI|nr:hypothetical protein AC579_9446 [Pseudocercospora musae]
MLDWLQQAHPAKHLCSSPDTRLTPAVIASVLASLAYAQHDHSNTSLVRLPSELLYLLPQPFDILPRHSILLAPCDDLVVARNNYTGRNCIYATTFSIHTNIPAVHLQLFDTAVLRYSLSEKTLLPVMGPNEQRAPNGIRVSPDGKKLYVTNTPLIGQDNFKDQAKNTTKANSIFVFDLDSEEFPRNGRVWTSENDGINVRNEEGVGAVGEFGHGGWRPVDEPFIANFAHNDETYMLTAKAFWFVTE